MPYSVWLTGGEGIAPEDLPNIFSDLLYVPDKARGCPERNRPWTHDL